MTIDADSVMAENALREVDRALASGRFIGGGVPVHPERKSLGILLAGAALLVLMLVTRSTAGMFWCRRADFEAVGGFNESLPLGEDLDFAKRLKQRGRAQGRKLGTLWRAPITTSCRKFDAFGDWMFFRLLFFHGREIRASLKGDTTLAEKLFYDFKH